MTDSLEAVITKEQARELLRYLLIRFRELHQPLQKELAAAAGVSQPYYAQWEAEAGPKQRRPSRDQLIRLLTFYGMTDRIPIMLRILDIAHNGKSSRDSNGGMLANLGVYLALEFFAEWLIAYEPLYLPGLLMTPEYTRAVLQASAVVRPELDIEAALRRRAQRQALLLSREPSPLHLTAYIEERALITPVGSPEIMYAARQHLLDQSERANITVRVLPDLLGPRPTELRPTSRPAALIGLTDTWQLSYGEDLHRSHHYDDPELVEQAKIVMRRFDELALDETESRQVIAALNAA